MRNQVKYRLRRKQLQECITGNRKRLANAVKLLKAKRNKCLKSKKNVEKLLQKE